MTIMAYVDKARVEGTLYDISPSPTGNLDSTSENAYTSSDVAQANATTWTNVDPILNTEQHRSIFSKLTSMIKNIRYLYNIVGSGTFAPGSGTTITDVVNNKAPKSHNHTAAQLPTSNSQINSTSYVPTSALIYSMNQTLNSLNDALDKISGSSANIKLRTTATQSMRLYTTREWVDNGYGSIVARYTSNSVTVYLNPTSSDSFVIVTCTTDKGVEKLMGIWIRINGSSYSGFVASNVTDGGSVTGGSGGSGMYGVKIYSYNLSSASPYITCQQLLQAVTTHDHTYTVKKYYYSSSL